MGQYYGKPCNSWCYYYMKCANCRAKGWAKTCGDKFFCREKFFCTYAHHNPNTGVSTKICENMNA